MSTSNTTNDSPVTDIPTAAPETLVAVLNEAATVRANGSRATVTPSGSLNDVPPRPKQAAPADTFRSDHPAQVASTGRPQLIEFFAHT